MKKKVIIPVVQGNASDRFCTLPILQLKELAPDEVRRCQYRAWLRQCPPPTKRKETK